MKPRFVSYRPFGGSGPLSVYFCDGPYGAAREADNLGGVGWFSASGDLLGVEFDDVAEVNDDQTLVFGKLKVHATMKSGKRSIHVLDGRRRAA